MPSSRLPSPPPFLSPASGCAEALPPFRRPNSPSLLPPPPLQPCTFASIDTDRTGTITPAELQRALALGGLHFSLMACAQMVRQHDRDNSGCISLPEFRSLHTQLGDIRAAFTAAARGGDSIGVSEVEQLVQQQGYQLEPPAFQSLIRSFDPDRNSRFGLPEYTMLVIFLKSSRDIFAAFDPQRSGKATFDFSQFVYAAAHTR